MQSTSIFKQFISSEKSGGMLLIFCTLLSLVLANSNFSSEYLHFWHFPIANQPLEYWINDGLMTIFFLLIGLELEREVYNGELSNIKNALLPISGALGGMIVPALLYLSVNWGTTSQSGAGIPMATDIAFALGILSLLGNKVPTSLKIFLTALAVIDDLGAILVIAFFYTENVFWGNLGIAMALFAFMLLLNRLKVHNMIPYLLLGVAMWYFMLHSGVHATITGVLLAFAMPFSAGDATSPSIQLQKFLHYPVAFVILPIFALANTAIEFQSDLLNSLKSTYATGIAFGLLVGKPLGIMLFSYLSVRLKIGVLPEGSNWKTILGAGFLGGIGFTMSIFISLLAFSDQKVINNSKIMILIASLIAGIIGFSYLKRVLKHNLDEESNA
jgi:NhaA family Na+:H+ antiporter